MLAKIGVSAMLCGMVEVMVVEVVVLSEGLTCMVNKGLHKNSELKILKLTYKSD